MAARDAAMRNVALTVLHVVAPIVTGAQGWPGVPVTADSRRAPGGADGPDRRAGQCGRGRRRPSHADQIGYEVVYEPVLPALVEFS